MESCYPQCSALGRWDSGKESATEMPNTRSTIIKQSIAVGAATVPFGFVFGAATQDANMRVAEAVGFSILVFTGSAQFAAVSVLGNGGSVSAAVIAGLLLNLRSLAFGVAMGPALKGPWWWRALVSQLMIDEATAVGTAQQEQRWRRYGFLATGIAVFVFFNLATLAGATLVSDTGNMIHDFGIDAVIPAAFLGLLWSQLGSRSQRLAAAGGGIIAFATAPILPAGLPIVAAATMVVVLRPWRQSNKGDAK